MTLQTLESNSQAVQPPWQGLAVFVFWHDGPELTRVSGEHEGSALQGLDGLHVSPRTAPSKRAKFCTYFAWFLLPSQLKSVPYFELPMSISRVQLLMQFRMGSHALLVEQGRLANLSSPGISAAALCAGPGPWGLNGILFLTAPILPTFVASFGQREREIALRSFSQPGL